MKAIHLGLLLLLFPVPASPGDPKIADVFVPWTDAFSYSCLTGLPDGTIGCLYEAEGTSKIVFTRFTLDWLTDGKDRLEKKEL